MEVPHDTHWNQIPQTKILDSVNMSKMRFLKCLKNEVDQFFINSRVDCIVEATAALKKVALASEISNALIIF